MLTLVELKNIQQIFYQKINCNFFASQRWGSDSVTDSSVLSNPAEAQNVSCLGLYGRDICTKSSAL